MFIPEEIYAVRNFQKFTRRCLEFFEIFYSAVYIHPLFYPFDYYVNKRKMQLWSILCVYNISWPVFHAGTVMDSPIRVNKNNCRPEFKVLTSFRRHWDLNPSTNQRNEQVMDAATRWFTLSVLVTPTKYVYQLVYFTLQTLKFQLKYSTSICVNYRSLFGAINSLFHTELIHSNLI